MAFDLSKIGVKMNIPKVNFTDYSGLFVAPPKFGKTTTASKFKGSVIVPFEVGTKGAVVNVAETVKDWQSFIEWIDDLEEYREDIGDAIQTIVFDTVNKAYEWCEKYTLKQLSIIDKKRYRTMGDVPHGKAYSEKDKFFIEQIDRILALGFNILFISHLKVKTVRPKNGEPYDVYSSTMPERLEAIVNPLVDFILTGEKRVIDGVEKRVLITKGNAMADAGGRVVIDEDIVFDTEDEAIEKYQELFKESVMRKLKEHGINRDYEELSKEQAEEKLKEAMKYVEQNKENKSTEEIIAEVDKAIKSMSSEQQAEVKKQLKDRFKSINYKKYDVEQLKEALSIVNEILSA